MKICDLTQFYSPLSGGVKRYLSEKRRYIASRVDGSEHILVVPGEHTRIEREPAARTYSVASPLISRKSRYRALLNLHAVEEVLERERPDVIESGDPYQMAWKAIASGSALRIPVVAFYHSHFPEAYLRSTFKYFGRTATEFAMDLSRRYIRTLYSQFERTFVPSEKLAALLRDWGVPRIVATDLGVDVGTFRPDEQDGAAARGGLGVPEDARLLLYVGRLAVEKNTRTLFQAFRLLHRREPGRYRLLAVGDGNQRGLLEDLRKETGAVIWKNYCADTGELARLYRAADIFVHPGVLETFGLVTLEAQACAIPVVGIRGSYMDRIIFSDQSHWARENSPEALADAIASISGGDFRAIGAAASQSVRDRFSWNSVFQRIFGVYREAAATYDGPRRG